jgi:hypothetical protein
LLAFIVAGAITIGVRVLTEPGTTSVQIYACVQGQHIVWWGPDRPERCPTGSELVYDPDVTLVDQDKSIGHRLTVVLRNWLSIPGVMATFALASCLWLVAGWKLHDTLPVSWLLVPLLLLVTAVCVAGPGHWFPKEPYEGPSIVPLGTRDALTALDLVGMTIGAFAAGLGIYLATHYKTQHRSPSDT